MRFYLSTGRGRSLDGYKESWILAEENSYYEMKDGLEDWLIENLSDRYYFETELIPDEWVEIELYVVFQNDEDVMAYKLRWE